MRAISHSPSPDHRAVARHHNSDDGRRRERHSRLWLMVATLCGGTLAGGANTFNMVIDRDIDAIMERTKRRRWSPASCRARRHVVRDRLEVVAFVVLALWVNQLSRGSLYRRRLSTSSSTRCG